MNNKKDYYISLQAKIDENASSVNKLNNQIKKLQDKISSLEIKIKTPTTASKGFGDLNTQLNKLKINMGEFEKNVLSANSTFDTTTTRYTNNAGKILTVTERIVDGESKYKVSLKEVNKAIEENARQANSWGYSWEKAWKGFLAYTTIQDVFYLVKHGIEEMIDEVADLDSALIELQKVTTLEGASLDAFTKKAYEAGSTVAKTGTEMIEAATEFAKAGFGEDEILELGRVANLYTNIADEEISAGKASEFIIAQIKAFNLEAKDAISIVDALNEVSNKYAVSSADLSENLGKVSATLAATGTSYEESLGLITAITEVTRNANTASNALKTISARLRGFNEDGEEITDLVPKLSKEFSQLGIDMYGADGQIKSTYELTKDLAEVWPTLTKNTQTYLGELFAGKYQLNNFLALMNNFDVAISATADAMNSSGSATRENEKVLDSIKGHLAGLNSAWEEFSQNVMSGDLLKGIIDFGKILLNVANSGFGQFVIKSSLAFASIKSGLLIFGALVSNLDKIKKGFSSLNTNLLSSIKNIDSFKNISKIASLQSNIEGQTIEETTKQMTLLGISTEGVTTKKEAQIAVNNALKASQLSLNLALAGASLVITGVISLYQKQKQKQEELARNTVEFLQNTEQEVKSLDDTISKIKTLKNTMESSTSSYQEAVTAREELSKIQQDLINDYGIEAGRIDLVSGSIEEQIKELRKLKQEYAEEKLKEKESQINKAKKEIYGKNKYTRYIGNVTYTTEDDKYIDEEIKKILNKYGKINEFTDTWTTKSVDDSKKALEEWKKYLQDNNEELIKTGEITKEQYDYNLRYIDGQLDKIKNKYGIYYDELEGLKPLELTAAGFDVFEQELKELASTEGLTSENVQTLINQYPGLQQAIQDSDKELTNSTDVIEMLRKKYQDYNKAVDNIGETMGEEYTKDIQKLIETDSLNLESIEALKDKYKELENVISDNGMKIEDYVLRLSNLVQKSQEFSVYFGNFSRDIDSVQEAFKTLTEAQEEYNEAGYLSIDTIQSLLSLDSEYLGYLFDENGQLNLNTEAFRQMTIAKIDDLIATENQRHYNAVLEISESKLNATTKETIGWFQTLWNVITGGKTKVEETKKSLEEIEASIKQEGDPSKLSALEAENKLYNERIALYNEMKDSIGKDVTSALVGGSKSSSGGSKSSSSASKSSKEWWEEQLDALKDQFKYNEITIEEYINGLSNLLGQVGKGTDAWKKINEELQKQRLTKVEDDYKRGVISAKEYVAQLKELIKAYKQGSEAWLDLADKIKKGLQDIAKTQKDDLETAADAAMKIIDDEIDRIDSLREAEEKRYDELIEAKEKANDETEKEIELARLQEALENAKNEKNKRVWTGTSWEWMADEEAIREAEEALEEARREEDIEKLKQEKEEALKIFDEKIDSLEEYKTTWEDVADSYEEAQKKMILAQQLGSDAEKNLLSDRIKYLEEYRTKYLNTMKEIETLENQSSIVVAGGTTSSKPISSAGSSTASSNQTTYVVKSGDTLSGIGKKYGVSWQKIYDANKGTIGSNPNLIKQGQKLTIPGYADGGIVDYTGLAMLHGTKNQPEYVLNNDQVKNMLSNITRPQTSSNFNGTNSSTNNYNFGNIELPNVTNAKQFVTELKSLINITKHQ